MSWSQAYFLWLMLIGATVFAMFWLLLLRKRLRIHAAVAVLLAVLHTAYGLCCVKAFAILEGASAGSMSLFGAVFFMPLAYFLIAKGLKRPTGTVFDLFTVPLVFTLMLARCNCLFKGCCLGRFISGTSFCWPTRETEILFYVLFLAAVIPRVWKDKGEGRIYPLYMLSYGAFRAVNECFRASDSGMLFHISHIWALLAFGLGLSIYSEQKRKRISMDKRRKRK